MQCMFEECKNFEGKGLNNWDVSNVYNMGNMFYRSGIVENLSSWNVEKCKDKSDMFKYCDKLKRKPKWY